MNIDGAFYPDGVTASNIAEISEANSRLTEERICEIAELARSASEFAVSMLSDGYTVYETLSLISDGVCSVAGEVHSDLHELNEGRLLNSAAVNTLLDRAVFSEIFTECMRKGGVGFGERIFLNDAREGRSFVYVKNAFADEAFDVFTQDMADARVSYVRTLSDAARAVASGDASFCLLPLEERGGARLFATSELLFKDDLKIAGVTPVFGFDGNADIKYAMISRSFFVPDVCEGDDRYLEIRLRADTSIKLSELFLAADILGASVYRVNSIAFTEDEGLVPYWSVVFRDDGHDFSPLLAFLTLFSGAYTAIGIYKNLE